MTRTHVFYIKNCRTISAIYIMRHNCPQAQVDKNMALKQKIEVRFKKIILISCEKLPLLILTNCFAI